MTLVWRISVWILAVAVLACWPCRLAGQVAAVGGFAETGGSVEGVVLDDDGKPVRGVQVRAFRSSIDGPVRAGLAGSAVTDREGRFSIGKLPAAPYVFCVDASSEALLDPCEWSAAPPVLRVKDGETAKDQRIQLERGVTFRLRVEDPDDAVQTRANEQANGLLVVGTWGPRGFFRPAKLTSSGNKGHDYTLLLPAESDFRLTLEGQGISLADSAGKAVGPGTAATLRGSAGQTPPVLTFRAGKPKP